MAMEKEAGRQALPVGVALLSIAGFWAFYFLIASLRAMLVGFEDQLAMLGPRLMVVCVAAAITYLFYLVLRRQPMASVRRSIGIAALLAIPASIVFSTVNYMAFREFNDRMAQTEKEQKVVSIDERTGAVTVREAGREIRIGGSQNPPQAPDPAEPVPPEPDLPAAPAPLPAPPEPPAPPPAPPGSSVYVQVGNPKTDEDKPPLVMVADNGVNSYFFFAAWAALYLALCYAAETRVLERRAARLQSAAKEAELKALRYQINPHFLFNTLNSLSSLIMTAKPAEAEGMIMNLSNFFRATLAANPTEDVTLEEEIGLQRLYLDIESVRFPGRLKIDTSVPDELKSACVPALILQPLIENAIKHGVARAKEPVTIAIEARADSQGLLISVENDGPHEPGAKAEHGDRDESRQHGMGIGLRNVQDRLAARFGGEASCRWGALPKGGFAVTMTMPIIRHGC